MQLLTMSITQSVSTDMEDRMDDSCSFPEQTILSSSSMSCSTSSDSTDISATRSRGHHHHHQQPQQQQNDNDIGNVHQDDPKTAHSTKQFLSIGRNAIVGILQLSNIFLWYYTNGMNGIAMESFAKPYHQLIMLQKEIDMSTPQSVVFIKNTFNILKTTCFVTSRQLLVGAVIGRLLLLILHPAMSWQWILSSNSSPLSFLHAMGSLATNLGFMYGKASVIQVLKLLEPFETLLLSQLFYREGLFTVGIMSSMMVVVGGAMSLLRLQPVTPAPQAIFAALASGLLLSCRNVLQRKHQSHHLQPLPTQQQQQAQIMTSYSSDALPVKSHPNMHHDLSELVNSVVQFTQLSFFSGMMTGLAYVLLWLGILCVNGDYDRNPSNIEPNIQVYLWHPLYNIFSMITLGFCSALTHSLLNAGKRVFAICMAMIWFQEGLDDPAKIGGLLIVAFGGCWYTAATKAAKSKK
jgi:hypothetical protein